METDELQEERLGRLGGLPGLGIDSWIDGGITPKVGNTGEAIGRRWAWVPLGRAYGGVQYKAGHLRPEA